MLGATPTFVIIGAGGYALMVLPMARYPARREARQQSAEIVESAKAEVGEIRRLRDIRDALAAPRSGGTG